MRPDHRRANELRPIRCKLHAAKYAEGSCLIEWGQTVVLCAASVEEKVPPFLKGTGRGWVTAEYGMLPRSTHTRTDRERSRSGGRTSEIQRLIGRSLRAVTQLDRLGERTIIVDCDVLQADGGTRCAAITGGYVALALACATLHKQKKLTRTVLSDHVAAVSVGMLRGQPMLDLAYTEDSQADVDMNVVMTGHKLLVEVQGTAERVPFSSPQLQRMLALAQQGVTRLLAIQRTALASA